MKIVQEHVASRQLPGLLAARLYHACAAYTVEGAQVELTLFRINLRTGQRDDQHTSV